MSEERMAEQGDWDSDFNKDETKTKSVDRPKTEYMDMTIPGEYTVRLVGPYVKCRKQFKPYKATCQEDEKDINPAWKAGFWPSKRYAVNVIDRADGKLKVMEKGPTVFEHFHNYKGIFKIEPNGKDGPDFRIVVTIPKDESGEYIKMETKYAVVHLEKAPFTEEEVAMIKTQKLWPLTKIYKSTTPEKMQEMWDALSDSQKTPPKRDDDDNKASTPVTEAPAEVVSESMADAPAEEDDLFGDTAEASAEGENSTEMF